MLMLLRPLNGAQVHTLLHHLPQRAHLTQTRHVLDAQVRGKVNLGLRGEPTQAKPNRSMRQVLRTQECMQ